MAFYPWVSASMGAFDLQFPKTHHKVPGLESGDVFFAIPHNLNQCLIELYQRSCVVFLLMLSQGSFFHADIKTKSNGQKNDLRVKVSEGPEGEG